VDLRPIEFLFDTVKGIVADFPAGPQGGQGTTLRQDGMMLGASELGAGLALLGDPSGLNSLEACLIFSADGVCSGRSRFFIESPQCGLGGFGSGEAGFAIDGFVFFDSKSKKQRA
jgi:hypothetical protein